MDHIEDDHLSYSRTALARLVLSDLAHEVAAKATGLVGTRHDEGTYGGETIDHALQVFGLAGELLQAAVIYERERGLSWDRVGEALDGITRQSAHTKYAEAEAAWRQGLLDPINLPDHPKGIASLNVPDAAYQPTAAARRLDEWLRHHGRAAEAVDEHPVSGHLPPLSTTDEISQLLAAIRHAMSNNLTGERYARLFDRKAAVFDRIAAEEGRDDAREMAAGARARAAEIRAQHTDPDQED